MWHEHAPHPALQPFVRCLWALERSHGRSSHGLTRERVLPRNEMHIAIRVRGDPVQVFPAFEAERGVTLGYAVVGGARAGFYVRDLGTPVRTIGVQLRPGAAQALFGVPADEIAERHTPLAELWGSNGTLLLAQLHEVGGLDRQMRCLESVLLERLRRPLAPHGPRALHPAVAQALRRFAIEPADVRGAARESGLSHRRFGTLFRRAVGIGPKAYCRVARLQRALELSRRTSLSWAQIAAEAGYADQSHLTHEWRALTGATPGSGGGSRPAKRTGAAVDDSG